MLFLLPSEVYSREELGNVDRAVVGGLSPGCKNGHLSITLFYMLIIIPQSHHSAGVSSSNKGKTFAYRFNCMYWRSGHLVVEQGTTPVAAITLSKLKFKMISVISAVLFSQFFHPWFYCMLKGEFGLWIGGKILTHSKRQPEWRNTRVPHRFLDNQITPLMLIMSKKIFVSQVLFS